MCTFSLFIFEVGRSYGDKITHFRVSYFSGNSLLHVEVKASKEYEVIIKKSMFLLLL